MAANKCFWRRVFVAGWLCTLVTASVVLVTVAIRDAEGCIFTRCHCGHGCDNHRCGHQECLVGDVELSGEPGGTWYWMRSPEEEGRVVIGLYNRYCIRCHGVDGRGVWDIPDVPDFTNPRWQACRSDAQLVRATLEGRGAVMPPFRGTLTLEEAWGMARYLRTFIPGTEVSRPDIAQPETPTAPAPKKLEQPSK